MKIIFSEFIFMCTPVNVDSAHYKAKKNKAADHN